MMNQVNMRLQKPTATLKLSITYCCATFLVALYRSAKITLSSTRDHGLTEWFTLSEPSNELPNGEREQPRNIHIWTIGQLPQQESKRPLKLWANKGNHSNHVAFETAG